MRHCWRWILPCILAATASGQEMPPANVVVGRVVEREVTEGRSFVGAVEPSRTSTVGCEVEGLVVASLVEEGDRVEEGQPLARLRTRVLESRLASARAELSLREQELAELENGSRPEEIAEARARVAQAQADLDLRNWKIDVAQRLYKSESISEDELKEAVLAAEGAKAKLAEEQAALALVEAGPRKERIAQAQARVEAAQAEVDRIQDDVERSTIRAPFTGYVVAEHTQVGEWLAKGADVADVVALDQIDVTIPVLEDYVHGLRKGMEVVVAFDALGGRSLIGTLRAIVPRADERARTFPVKVRIENERTGDVILLKQGMFARVTLQVGETRTALLVSKDAVVLGDPRGPKVFVVGDDNSLRAVYVRLGLAVDTLVEVQGEIAAGQKVVVRGNERIFPGQTRAVIVGEE